MARRTHRMMAANEAVRDTGMPTQANSISAPCVKVFVSCEDALPATTVVDIVSGVAFIDNAVSPSNQISSGDDAYSLSIGSLPPSNQVAGNPASWVDPAGNDWIYFGVMRAKVDPSIPGSGYAVYIEHNLTAGNSTLRMFPYMMDFIDRTQVPAKTTFTRNIDTNNWSWQWNGGSPSSGIGGWECDYCDGWNLVEDQVYSIGGARRGDWMEHYFNGKLVGKVNVREAFAGTYPNPPTINDESGGDITLWENFGGGAGLELTHSGHTGVGCISTGVGSMKVGHWPADFYGLKQFVFSGGLPSVESVEYWMTWMKERWQEGKKISPPEWMTL